MDIVRVIKSKDYTTICNRIFKDRRLSLKAKGLLAMLLSFSDSWNLTIKGLEVILKEGRTSIRSTMSELIKFGYVERQQIRKDNKFIGVDYIVFESPKSQNLTSQNLTSQNSLQVSNNIINNQFNKDNSKNQFFIEVMAFENYTKEMLTDFFEYWSEPTKKGVLKKDTMKTWSTSRRLKTWAKNESKWALNSVGISKVDKHLQTHNEAMQILKQIQENDKKISEAELTKMCVELLSKTYLDLGQHNIDAKTKVLMAQSLAFDLKKSFPTLSFRDVKEAFWNGVRNTEDFSINAKTYYKWLKLWRSIIWNNEGVADHQKDKRLDYRKEIHTGIAGVDNAIKNLITNK